jgi:hypothetical protein
LKGATKVALNPHPSHLYIPENRRGCLGLVKLAKLGGLAQFQILPVLVMCHVPARLVKPVAASPRARMPPWLPGFPGFQDSQDPEDSGDSAFYCGASRLRATLARNAGYVECTVTEIRTEIRSSDPDSRAAACSLQGGASTSRGKLLGSL